ncbi:MAG: response regulator [Aggregatilineales bacterium]
MTKILIIEDSDDLRADIIEMLSLEGFTMLEARDGREGVEVAFSQLPDLIICDVMMPNMDGYQVLEALRAEPTTQTIPFVFLTSRAEHESQRFGMRLGADDYLAKPFNVSELIEVIRVQLKKASDARALADKQMEDLRMSIISAMPHELRTPLNTILGFSEVMMMEAETLSPEKVKEWAQFIHNAGMRLLRMTENYLVYARVSVALNDPDERASVRKQILTSPQDLLAQEAERVAQRHGRGADLALQLQPAGTIRCTYTYFVKIIDELVDNACKFSESGTPITVRTAVEPPYYVLYVEDQGRGINPEYLSQIGAYMQFDRWFYEQQGAGLGLGIVVQIVRLHEGVFNVTSTPNKGTQVKVGLWMSE